MRAIEYRPTSDDVLAATRLAWRLRWLAPRRLAMTLARWLLLGALFGAATSWAAGGDAIGAARVVALCAAVQVAMLGAGWLLLPLRTRRRIAREPALRAERGLRWDEEAIEIRLGATITRRPWSTLTTTRHGTQLVLRRDGQVILFVPARVLAPAQCDDLVALAHGR
ncbi:YcxB family protein [Sphingomonas sp. BK235]|uniref:YcxB family protein n=1 Tax=Sphingomonas sp. BK235 TaxID=2512131 RepID=UPI001045D34E|nr:YcxB family protein [Sphingomonas sp. BK235]TCP34322.1 hypothetical protein EV292_104314 [Sphingomonas sp. BK235]